MKNVSEPKRGRPSKLRPSQWEAIGKRLAQGEGVRALAREYKVSPTRISTRFSERIPKLKTLAGRIAEAETELESLPVSERESVRILADDMKATSQSLSRAAVLGSQAAMTLFRKSSEHIARLNEGDGFMEALETIHALAKTANENAKVGLALLKIIGEGANAANERPVHTPDQLRRMAELMERKR